MKINYLGKEITLKYTFRGYIIYENITGHSFGTENSIKDVIILFYAMLAATDVDNAGTFDTFIDWLDEHQHVLSQFSDWLMENVKKNNDLRDGNVPEKTEDETAEAGKKN